MQLLKVENVEKTYLDNGIGVHALRGVDLTVDEGEFLVIAGPSGSGKTTLLNILGSLDVPTEGKVFLKNEDIAEKSKSQRAEIRLNNIGFVFQAYNLIPVLSAMENVEFSMMLLGVPEKVRHEKAMKILNELEIGHLADKRPNQMSGGQQQRVAVARAIVNEPLIVIADEPTANLDTKTGAKLLDIMQKMNKEKNITFVFSSHDKQVMQRARRLLMLEDGRIVN